MRPRIHHLARLARAASRIACALTMATMAGCSGAPPRDAAPVRAARPRASASSGAAVTPAAPAPTADAQAPVGPVSCAGPADPALTAEKVRVMLQGDDTYPRDQIRALAPGVVPALVTLATSSPDDYARYRAITLLGDVGCRETAPALEGLLNDDDPLVRMYSTTAIKTMLGRDATPILARMLRDTDRGVVKFAIQGLGDVGDERALPDLERLRGTTREPWLREHAAKAIKRIAARAK